MRIPQVQDNFSAPCRTRGTFPARPRRGRAQTTQGAGPDRQGSAHVCPGARGLRDSSPPPQPRPPKSARPQTSSDNTDLEEKIPRRSPTPAHPKDDATAKAAMLIRDDPPLSPDEEPQSHASTSGWSMRQHYGAESSGARTDSTSYATLDPEVGEHSRPAVSSPSYAAMASVPPSPNAARPVEDGRQEAEEERPPQKPPPQEELPQTAAVPWMQE
ncbi:unnamed protein product, partial [Iphiclides podalirius]